MKIGFYSPYLPQHFGGGEKHFLTTAWYLAQKHDVEILIPQSVQYLPKRIQEYEQLFNLDLSRINWKKSPLASGGHAWMNWRISRQYDAFFHLTNGSIFFCGSPKSILHVQFPFTFSPSWIFKQKLKTWKTINANSEFTRQTVEENWQTTIPFLHYPYVRLPKKGTLPSKRPPVILAVGRFINPQDEAGHSKRQDLLIEAFRQGQEKYGWKKWQLLLIGPIEPGDQHQEYVRQLHQQSVDLPVQFYHGIRDKHLRELYKQSSIFWHAAGYRINENDHPKKVEHFGMSAIEAMAHGLIPIVIEKGGLKEIIKPNKNGFFFKQIADLVDTTNEIIQLKNADQQKIRESAYQRASDFSLDKFCQTIDQMLES